MAYVFIYLDISHKGTNHYISGIDWDCISLKILKRKDRRERLDGLLN